METKELADGRGGITTVGLWRPAPRMVCTYVRGFLTGDIIQAEIIPYFDRTLEINEPHSISAWHQWLDLTGQSSDARPIFQKYAQERPGRYSRIHILFGSKLTAMAVNVAALVLGNMEGYAEKQRFEAARDAEIASRKPHKAAQSR